MNSKPTKKEMSTSLRAFGIRHLYRGGGVGAGGLEMIKKYTYPANKPKLNT